MERRQLFKTLGLGAAAALLPDELRSSPPETDLKITSVRVVKVRPKRPVPRYEPAPGSWSTGRVEVANPVSIYPEYKPMRSLFMPDPGGVSSFWVEIGTNKGLTGLGRGGPGGGPIIEGHLAKLLLGKNALNIERIWDLLWRATMYYGRKGVVPNALSGIDLALWDIAGKAWGLPVYRLLGGETKPRIPSYCTGNDIEQHVEFGYTKLKLALPHGGRTRRHSQERGARQTRPRSRGERRYRGHGLLDGSDGAVYDRAVRGLRTLPGVLDGRMPPTRRL